MAFVFQLTLSENVQKVVELSQRIVVEKSVINQNEQVQKTSEISIENSKRVILSDNNSSSTSTTFEKSHEKMLESNGMVQNCEKFSDRECTVENKIKCNDEEIECKPKNSSSCNDLLMFGKSQMTPPPTSAASTTTSAKEQSVVPISAADFAIPYNIINNYFSGELR